MYKIMEKEEDFVFKKRKFTISGEHSDNASDKLKAVFKWDDDWREWYMTRGPHGTKYTQAELEELAKICKKLNQKSEELRLFGRKKGLNRNL